MKLHLGCGSKYIPGFYHIDALSYEHVDHVGRVDRLPEEVRNGQVELIYACHVLEHFGRSEYMEVLAEWFKALAPTGVLRLAVPDFEAVARAYVEGKVVQRIEDVLGLCVGGQRDKYDYHKMIFDEDSLTRALRETGFSEVRRWDWRQTGHAEMDDYSQSYLPHMDKEHGMLMSLNLEAIK
jgi:predicted SAM-dependent methyltransferase